MLLSPNMEIMTQNKESCFVHKLKGNYIRKQGFDEIQIQSLICRLQTKFKPIG